MSIDVLGTNHFAVSVSDLERSIKFYTEILGFRLLCRNIIQKLGVPVVHMDSPDSGFVLELYSPANASPVPENRKFPDTDMMVNGNKHFSLTIADHKKTIAQLEELGIPVIMTAPEWGTVGVFINDPDGNVIELFEGDMRDHVNV